MIRSFFLTIMSFYFYANAVYGQNYEFYGVVLLNGKKENSIVYKISFVEKKGVISGYSLTDINGDHETKNTIAGTYDSKTKMITFQEKNIIYTKSPISASSFCFITYTGKINLSKEKSNISGPFKGKFPDGKKCIDGTMTLIGSNTVLKLVNKANKQIQKSKKLDEVEKEKYNTVKIFDSLSVNQLVGAQNMNIFSSSEKVSFDIWDNEQEDGDIINLYHNNELILKNFEVKKAVFKVNVSLKADSNIFKIEAINQGTAGVNTAKIIMTSDEKLEFQSNLKTGESTSLTIFKK